MKTDEIRPFATTASPWADVVSIGKSQDSAHDGNGQAAIGFDGAGRMVSLAEAAKLRLQPALPDSFASNLVGGSQALHEVKLLVSKVAPTDARVLITGETGTGKELVATDIYANSLRKDKPLITVNCTAIPESLIASILFGHEKGAFTGADRKADGLFKAADGGTIFLDEIGELDRGLQAKLTRVIESGIFRRVGGEEDIKVNVRVVAATNKNIGEALARGEISRGLYDRLNTIHVQIPPLRDHIDDVPIIAVSLLEKHRNFVPHKVATVIAAGAMEALQDYDYPGNVRQLENIIRRAIVFSQGEVIKGDDIAFTKDEAGLKILEKFDDVAKSNATVLISGEHGVGKEVVANLICDSSTRSDKRVVIVDCAGITESVAESELFGHEKGAFTDAVTRHIGYFQQAHGGTLILDEIGELPLNVQAKLLRALQQGEIVTVGTKSPIKVDTRVIATSSQDLERAVQEGKFREDLYHRLSVLPLSIPPLRERKDEIPRLVNKFVAEFGKSKEIREISPAALDKLQKYDYPGNIRQLKAVIERATILADERSVLDTQHIVFDDFHIAEPVVDSQPITAVAPVVEAKASYPEEPENPLLKNHYRDLVNFILSNEKADLFDFKLRFLVFKYKVAKRIVESKSLTDRVIADSCGVSSNTARRLCLKFAGGTTVEMVRKLEAEKAAYELLSGGSGDALPESISLSSESTPEIPTNPVLLKHLKEFTDFAKEDEPINDDKLRFLFAKYRMAKLVHDRRVMNATDTAEELGYNQVTLQKILEPYEYRRVRDLRDELVKEFQ